MNITIFVIIAFMDTIDDSFLKREELMRNVTLEKITDAVVGALSQDTPVRQREIMTSLIKHMHDFCREVNLQSDEFLKLVII